MKRIVIIVLILLLKLNVYAYDNEKVHQLINENASLRSSNFITTMKALGFTGNSPSEIIELNVVNGKKIKDWFHDGAKEEDIPLVRSYNHFHDPTKSWDKAGLDDYVLGILHVKGDSSVLWAQNPDQKYIASDGTVYDVNGTWSWPKARDYYYQALISTDKMVREQNFANTFRTLGQVMHLLGDSAVPEHVRNEEHALGWHYEKWCEQNSATLNTTATVIDYSITNNSLVSGLIPITNFWDTMPSPGYNLNPIGLSEYTNFNFLGRDTIFKNYTYPEKPNTLYLEPIIAEDGTTDYRVYFSGATSDGQNINHLASTGYLWSELSAVYPDGVDDSRFNLDDKCFEDYSPILVPKAIGFSAGLLNYFFRGEITMLADLDNPSQYIIKNESSEDMAGTFSLYYDDTSDNRYLVANWGNLAINANSQSNPITFIPPIDPEPKEKGKYTLVFQGSKGNETSAVIGKNISLCEEAAPVTLSGPEAPGNGSQYTATGGIPPYTWTISKGSITQNGVVTVSGQCGAATVTVTDTCGTTSKDVRMPSGAWHLVSDTCYIPCNLWIFNTWWQPETCDRIGATCNIEDGIQRITYYMDAVGSGYNPSYSNCPTASCTLSYKGTSYGNTYQVKLVYEWRCP